MSLFQQSVLKKYLSQQDKEQVQKAYKKYSKYFHNPAIQENIRNSKEEQFQEGFLRELFVDILGYTLNPAPKFNLTTELKNIKGAKKVDGAILKDGNAIAVIELKGTNTKDLESIRQQAFDYKANQTGCVYVITSNFEKLRFYINNAVEHEEFNLFTLTYNDFEVLFFCLAKEYILSNKPLIAKEASIIAEENITKKLYADYSFFKRELYRDLVRQNRNNSVLTELSEKTSKLILFKKSQKLIDRFLFILFAEDRGLLAPNSILNILNEWKALQDLDITVPLYDRYKQYFNYLDTGRKGTDKKEEIFAYNGGLFQSDAILDAIILDDDLLYRHTKKLSTYDFQSQIDVNILGHIFEHSLNEIESVNAEIEGTDFDKQKTKRKKDGVFYTPKYVTKYIVDNTIGILCTQKKKELGIIDEEYAKGRKNRHEATIKKLDQQLKDYRQWLLELTICDPACGSGAFLNQALDFLIKEHNYLDELTKQLLGGFFVFPDVENQILEHNIYGVDLNEESIEIAKLSLWLRTAQPKRKLTSLSNNIKCGNSLIESKAIAGEKGFNWKDQFPEVFTRGGFDVVIGNPPYVGEKGHSEIFESLKRVPKWNAFYRRRSNTYYFFIKHGVDILRNNGIQSLIIPREFSNADWANKVRQEVIENSKIIEIVDFNNLKVFDDAGTTSLILTQQKIQSTDYNFYFKSLTVSASVQNDLFDQSTRSLIHIKKLISDENKPWSFNSFEIKYSKKIRPLGQVFEIAQGLVTGADKVTNKHIIASLIDEKFIGRGIFILALDRDIKIDNHAITLKINDKWIELNNDDKSFIKPYYKPEHLQQWNVSPTNTFILYVGENQLTQNIKNYLLQFDKILLNRSTINGDKIITLNDFENYTIDDIKLNYSSAGAVQKIMRQKKWYLPLYERTNVPFDFAKIVVNTKNMNVFTFSNSALYSSGGGAGGQNFIYLKNDFKKQLLEISELPYEDFIIYTNAVLNSSVMQFLIQNGQFNQLSTSKIADLPLFIPEISTTKDSDYFKKIIEYSKDLMRVSADTNLLVDKVLKYLSKYFSNLDSSKLNRWYELTFTNFVSELNKSLKAEGKLELVKKEEIEWMEIFEDYKQQASTLNEQIKTLNKEIDKIIFELYGLNPDEIRIIENN